LIFYLCFTKIRTCQADQINIFSVSDQGVIIEFTYIICWNSNLFMWAFCYFSL